MAITPTAAQLSVLMLNEAILGTASGTTVMAAALPTFTDGNTYAQSLINSNSAWSILTPQQAYTKAITNMSAGTAITTADITALVDALVLYTGTGNLLPNVGAGLNLLATFLYTNVSTLNNVWTTTAQTLVNKTAVASHYTLDQGNADASAAVLATVTSDPATAAAIIDAPPAPVVVGQTFTLTTAADTLDPNSAVAANKTTAGDDTIRGPADGLLNTVDYIDASTGNDTLTATVTANSQTLAPTIKNVETITLTVDAADTKAFTFNATDVTDAEVLNIKNAGAVSMGSSDELITVSNLAKTTTLGIIGGTASTGATASEITATFASAAAADTQKVAISTLGKVGVLTLSTAETVQITATGTGTTGANTIGSLAAGSVKNLNLLGSGDLTVSASNLGATTTVDATQATGIITFAAEAGTTSFTFKGGSGVTSVSGTSTGTVNITTGAADDTINISGGDSTATVSAGDGNDRVLVGASSNITTADVISGGNGTNTIVVSDTAINTTTKTNLQKGTSNFQVLGTTATAAVTIDFNALSYIDSVRVEGADAGASAGSGAGAASVTATMENADTLTLAAVRVGQIGAANSGGTGFAGGAGLSVVPKLDGGANAATLVFVDNADITGGKGGACTASAGDGGAGGAAVNASTIEQLNIVLHGSDTTADTVTLTGGAGGAEAGSGAAGAAGVGLIVEANSTITITDAKIGSGTKYSNLDLGTVTGNNVIINASGLHGNLTVTAADGNVQVTGGSGADTITGGAGIDTINGGTGDDIIDGKAGADILAGGGGRDNFVISAATNSGTTTYDKISDFGKVTVATTTTETAAMTAQASFVATATAKGGADADFIKFSQTGGAPALAAAASGTDVSLAVTGTPVVTGTISAKGVVTVAGAGASQVDTLAEWVAVAKIMTANTNVAVFEFNGNSYVYNETAGGDDLVELTGVTGVTGIVLLGSSVAAAAGDIFVL